MCCRVSLYHDQSRLRRRAPTQLRGEVFGDVLGSAHPLGDVYPTSICVASPTSSSALSSATLLICLRLPHIDDEFGVLAGLAQHLRLLLVPDESPELLYVAQRLL
jgi:hypothetical protein